MSKIKIRIPVEVEAEDVSAEVLLGIECAVARFIETLEAHLDQAFAELRWQHPDCKFEIGNGDDEEWKE